MTSVEIERHGSVAIIAARPPGDTQSLRVALEGLAADTDVTAVVIAGLDVVSGVATDADAAQTWSVRALADRIETMPCPVVAALSGDVTGGGMQIALACHWRVAAPGGNLGLTETRYGLLPDAGGTQRLPRLIGPRRAAEMIAQAEMVATEDALALGLVDTLAPGDLIISAIGQARGLALQPQPPRPTRVRTERVRNTTVDAAVLRGVGPSMRGLFAPARAVEAVDAACRMTFEAGMAEESRLAAACRANPQSQALMHTMACEAEVRRPPPLPSGVPAPPIRKILLLGYSATRHSDAFADSGLMLLHPDRMKEADFVYATGENDLRALRTAMRADAILASPDPGVPTGATLALRLAGVAEIVQGPVTPDPAAAALMQMLMRANWLPVLIRTPGSFLTNTLTHAWRRATEALVASGVHPEQVLRACAMLGFTARPTPVRPAPGGPPKMRQISDEAIIHRCVAAVAEEGRRLIAEGMVRSVADIDVAAIHGLGFPRYRGGPMFWAERFAAGAE